MLTCIALSLALSAPALAHDDAPDDGLRTPEPMQFEGPAPERLFQEDRKVASGFLDSTVHLGLLVWRNFITLGDSSRCPFQPSCSGYARQAFGRERLGGYILTFDRLLRDSNVQDYRLAPDGNHYLDPLDDHVPVVELLSGSYCRRKRADGAELCI